MLAVLLWCCLSSGSHAAEIVYRYVLRVIISKARPLGFALLGLWLPAFGDARARGGGSRIAWSSLLFCGARVRDFYLAMQAGVRRR